MNVNTSLTAVNSGDALQQSVGISLLGKAMDSESALAGKLLQDFAENQQQIAASVAPHLGRNLDIRV
jgi:hypothetical protein